MTYIRRTPEFLRVVIRILDPATKGVRDVIPRKFKKSSCDLMHYIFSAKIINLANFKVMFFCRISYLKKMLL